MLRDITQFGHEHAHSLSNRADARSFAIIQAVRGHGPAMRPPLAARPEGRSADLPQECDGIIARKFASGDSNTEASNTEAGNRPPDRPQSSACWYSFMP